MTAAKSLKYIRTTQGFIVFPCLAATHKQVGDATGWLKISAGFVDWDFDGRPLCMGESESLGMKSLPEDTELLRAEWGMTAPAFVPPSRADLALADDISKVCKPIPLAR